MPKISYIGNQAPVICTTCPLRWRFAASDPDFRLSEVRRLRRRIYCLARSESCASVRSLGILDFSGCVGGFFMPKNRGTSTHKCAFCYFCRLGLARPAKA